MQKKARCKKKQSEVIKRLQREIEVNKALCKLPGEPPVKHIEALTQAIKAVELLPELVAYIKSDGWCGWHGTKLTEPYWLLKLLVTMGAFIFVLALLKAVSWMVAHVSIN